VKTISRLSSGPGRALIGAVSLGLAINSLAAAADRFGFSGREIFPIENQISQLHVADLDGDGLNDIVVANNARAKLTLLYNQTGKTNLASKPGPGGRREINELPPDARFRLASLASEKRITALAVADLNSDGRPDLAYYGDPAELVVLYNEGSTNWSVPRRWPLDDGQLTQNALATGDLNGDGRTDVALLSENCVYILFQQADQTLGEPQKLPISGAPRSIQIVDVDGDGRSDLLLVEWGDRNPFRFRRQTPDGGLGPEIYFASAPIRSYWADRLDARRQIQVITIAQYSGRARISEFTRQPAKTLAGSFRQGQFQVWPLSRTDKARRGQLWADINGDGRPDLLIAEPESGQVSLSLQQPDGSQAVPIIFPTLAGISDLAVADAADGGPPEIFMLSADERQVGVTRLDEKQRLPFPTLIPLPGRPLALATGQLCPGAAPVLAVLAESEAKEEPETQRLLVLRSADGRIRTQKLSASFKANPAVLAFHDADQDGLVDLVALTPYEKVKILRQVPDRDFEELDVAPPGGARELAQPWLGAADIDGDGRRELLLAQKNFLRTVVLAREAPAAAATNQGAWAFTVREQINGADRNSRLAGAAAIPNGTNVIASLFLLDAERKALTLCERDSAGVWQVVRNVPLPVAEFTRLQPLTLGADRTNAVALLGLNAVACLPLDGQVWELTDLDSYETPIKDGFLTDVVSGDLDQDGRKDLVFLETARNYLDLVLFSAQRKLVPANRWQVFEERTYRGRRGDSREPREAAIADVTGDGKNDLIIIVHDRVIVYPQE
jgi:hypothetical protein